MHVIPRIRKQRYRFKSMIYLLPSAIASLIGIFGLILHNDMLVLLCFLFLCGLCGAMCIDYCGGNDEEN